MLDSQAKHFPYSLPSGGGDGTAYILIHRSFITGYSTTLRIPLWVGYQLHREVFFFVYVVYNQFQVNIKIVLKTIICHKYKIYTTVVLCGIKSGKMFLSLKKLFKELIYAAKLYCLDFTAVYKKYLKCFNY